MSLATDILKHSGSLIPSSKTERREPLSAPETKPHSKYCYRSGNSWYAQAKVKGVKYYLGTHKSEARAGLAARLFLYWVRRYNVEGIPIKPGVEEYAEVPKPERLSLAQIHKALRYGHPLTDDEIKSLLTEVLSHRL